MDRSGGRENPSLLANAFEAILGAIYLDHGYSHARQFVVTSIERTHSVEEVATRRENFKSLLLEFAQARGWPQPEYRLLSAEGPGHDRTFDVEVVIGTTSHGSGRGKSKKSAEQQAAKSAFKRLEKSSSDKSGGVALAG